MAVPNTPITRRDYYLAAAAGQDVSLPAPVTREDKYLSAIAGRMNDFLSRLESVSASGGSIAEDSITELVRAEMQAWENEMYWLLYGSLHGTLLIYQGRALDKVTTDIACNGTTAYLTVISALGESTTAVEIDASGEIPIGCFSSVKTGFNLIFCETDPTQRDGNKLVGPTAIPLNAIYARCASEFADMTFSQFLTAHNLRKEYVLVQPHPQELDPNRKYFIRFYESFQPIWESLDTTDGYYFVGINELEDAQDRDIYTLEIMRTGE